MHLTFAQAYAIVCPDGGAVTPHSKQYEDIMALMKQSGYKHYSEKVVEESVPRMPRSVQEAMPFIVTREAPVAALHTSRREWMSVEVNKQAFLKALNKNNNTS